MRSERTGNAGVFSLQFSLLFIRRDRGDDSVIVGYIFGSAIIPLLADRGQRFVYYIRNNSEHFFLSLSLEM